MIARVISSRALNEMELANRIAPNKGATHATKRLVSDAPPQALVDAPIPCDGDGACRWACSSTTKTTAIGAATATSTPAATPTSITVQAGGNDQPNTSVAVLQFMPTTVNVNVGTPVRWSWAGDV